MSRGNRVRGGKVRREFRVSHEGIASEGARLGGNLGSVRGEWGQEGNGSEGASSGGNRVRRE